MLACAARTPDEARMKKIFADPIRCELVGGPTGTAHGVAKTTITPEQKHSISSLDDDDDDDDAATSNKTLRLGCWAARCCIPYAARTELKRPSSPSDSGASSADPEESSSFKDPFHGSSNRTTISPKVELPEVTLTKISPKVSRTSSTSSCSTNTTTDSFRPLMDRISPYLPHGPYRPETTPYFPMPFVMPPVSLALIATGKHDHEQHEPIDLSMKSKSSSSSGSPLRLGSTSPLIADVNDSEDLPSSVEVPRPVPLDLTFTRSKTLSG
ncbi:hypothetical protein RP20_CCG000544 [Aedes albopictus]|nr:hypothetical protein RP20_CCG000544 [Aedes albopictus]